MTERVLLLVCLDNGFKKSLVRFYFSLATCFVTAIALSAVLCWSEEVLLFRKHILLLHLIYRTIHVAIHSCFLVLVPSIAY